MLNLLLSAVLQLLLFLLIPAIAFFIYRKRFKSFPEYIGLKKSPLKANLMALGIALILAVPLLLLAVLSSEFYEIFTDPDSVTGMIRNMGFGAEAIATLLVAAVIKTSLSEEVFFRGFLAKRLISLVGFQRGNALQALIFGILHTLIFLSITTNWAFLTVIFVFPAIGAYVKVIVNEKYADGSIIPGWIAHGTANVIAYSFVGFVI